MKQTVKCRYCGMPLKDGMSFCTFCGKPMDDAAKELQYSYDWKKTSSSAYSRFPRLKKIAPFAIGVAVIVAIILIAAGASKRQTRRLEAEHERIVESMREATNKARKQTTEAPSDDEGADDVADGKSADETTAKEPEDDVDQDDAVAGGDAQDGKDTQTGEGDGETTEDEDDADRASTKTVKTGADADWNAPLAQYHATVINRHATFLYEDGGAEVVMLDATFPEIVSPEAPSKLKQRLNTLAESAYTAQCEYQLKREGETAYRYYIDHGNARPHVYRSDLTVTRADERIFSYTTETKLTVAGKTSVTEGVYCETYRADTGERLMLSDVVTSNAKIADIVIAELKKNEKVVRALETHENAERDLRNDILIGRERWSLTGEGLTLYLYRYYLTPDLTYKPEDIRYEITIAYRERPELFFDWVVEGVGSLQPVDRLISFESTETEYDFIKELAKQGVTLE